MASRIFSKLSVQISLDTSELRRDLAFSGRSLQDFSGKRVSAAQRRLQGFNRTVGKTSHTLANLDRIIAGIGFIRLVKWTVMAGDSFRNLDRRLSVLENSMRDVGAVTGKVGSELKWVLDKALQTGRNFNELSKAFTRLVPMAVESSISIDKVKRALEGTIGAGVVMGSTQLEMNRAFVAIGQIVGKDALQMEELRQQLGEALPNALIIASQGLTKYNEEMKAAGKFSGDTQVTVGKLVSKIANSEIDGAKFIEIWTRGTEKFIKFAKAGSQTVEGQVENLKTIMMVGVGRFMNESGISDTITAGLQVLNSSLMDFFSVTGKDAQDFGDSLFNSFAEAMIVIAEFFDSVSGFNGVIFDLLKNLGSESIQGVQDLIRSIRSMPGGDVIAEIGLIGFMFLGTKGKIGLVILSSIIDDFFNGISEMIAANDFSTKFDRQSKILSQDRSYNELGATGVAINQSDGLLKNYALQPIKEQMDVIAQASILLNDKAAAKDFLDQSEAAVRKTIMIKAVEGIRARLEELRKQQEATGAEATKMMKSAPLKEKMTPALTGIAKQASELRIKAKETGVEIIRLKGDLEKLIASVAGLTKFGVQEKDLVAKSVDAADPYAGAEKILINTKSDAGAKAVKNKLDEVRRRRKEIQKFNRDLKNERVGFSPSKGSLIDRIPINTLESMSRRYIGLVTKFNGAPSIETKIESDAVKMIARLAQDRKVLEELQKQKSPLSVDPKQIEQSIALKKLDSALKFRPSGTAGAMARQTKEQIKLVEKFRKEAIDTFGGKLPEVTQKWIEESIDEFKNRAARAKARSGRRANADALRQPRLEAAIARDINDSNSRALEVMIEKRFMGTELNALKREENILIEKGKKSDLARLYTLDERVLREKALGNTQEELAKELARQKEQHRIANDSVIQNLQFRIRLQEMSKEAGDISKQLEEEKLLRKDLIALDIQRLGLTREATERELQKLKNLNFQKGQQEVNMLNRQVQLQQRLNELKSFGQQNIQFATEDARFTAQEQYNDLLVEQNLLRNQELQMLNARNANLQSGNQLISLMNEWSITLGDSIRENMVPAAQSFASSFSDGFARALLGAQSFGDFWKGMVKQMLLGIVKFFTEWAIKRAAAWVHEQALNAARMTAEGTMATAQVTLGSSVIAALTKVGAIAQAALGYATASMAAAIAAAWTPAATVASIASFGAATTAGVTAMGEAILGMSAMSASAASASRAAYLSNIIMHDGGIVGASGVRNFQQLTGLKNDEQLTTLQQGELVIPADFADGALNALSGASDGFFSTDNVDGETANSIGGGVDIVNYFDFAQVEKHLINNPSAVVNIITQNSRDGGPIRRLGGRK